MTGRSSWASTALPAPTATLSHSPSVRQRFAARLSGWFMAASPLGSDGSADQGQPTEEQLRQARRQLRGAARWAHQYSADDSSVVCCIHPGSGVTALVEESKIAALVVAQRREISVLRSLRQLGSTTSALAAKSQCPLVVLRPDSVLGRSGGGVVVSVEDPIGDQSALRVGFEEAMVRGTRLTVLSTPTQLSPEPGRSCQPATHHMDLIGRLPTMVQARLWRCTRGSFRCPRAPSRPGPTYGRGPGRRTLWS